MNEIKRRLREAAAEAEERETAEKQAREAILSQSMRDGGVIMVAGVIASEDELWRLQTKLCAFHTWDLLPLVYLPRSSPDRAGKHRSKEGRASV